ncbi:hypothetical protein BD311DRAFT_724712 [Dichomitus squalens]|uniref:DUF6534 domain-containing protein n=1 Tax=Dichomitus squalens TaxID=114155 RepID=A0A4Q9MI95_9APHY|nr:hypothetical protein BD311DRAFT_724712 [Dichomitus squalens]
MVLPDNGVVLPPVRATMAWVLFGVGFALLFYGIMICQAYWYFQTYRKDPMDLKAVVAAIMVANAIDVGLILHACYYYAVGNYGVSDAFGGLSPSLTLMPLSIYLCIILCQYVYIRRTYLCETFEASFRRANTDEIIQVLPSKWQWVFLVLAAIVMTAATAFIIILTVQLVMQPTFAQWLRLKWLVSVAFGCSVLGDLALAGILSLSLHASRTGVKQTNALLNSIIFNAFSTGIVTSILSIACLLLAVFEGKNVVIIPLAQAAATVYANATLVTLNLRRGLSEKLNAPGESDVISLNLFQSWQQSSEECGRRDGTITFAGNRATC